MIIPTRTMIDQWKQDRISSIAQVWMYDMRDEIDRLTAANDALKATIDECRRALPPGTDGPGIVGGVLHLVEQRDALAKATTPAPEREAKIRAWETCALAIKDDGDYHPIDVYRVTLHEIRNGVALMRSAGDGKALLRELRAWICGEWSSALAFGSIRRILDGIDEMLAQPAPVEKPAAAVPKDDGELNKLASPPVAAAVPDDTRELVAQLAEAVAGLHWLDHKKIAEVAGIVSRKMRGGA